MRTAASGREHSFPSATRELTDAEILERYGDLIDGGISAFRQDPSYIVQMAETAASLRNKREARALKSAS